MTGAVTPMDRASGTNTGMAMVITTQQPPTANTVAPTSRNASGGTAFHAEDARLSSTSATSTSFSAFSSRSNVGPPLSTRR